MQNVSSTRRRSPLSYSFKLLFPPLLLSLFFFYPQKLHADYEWITVEEGTFGGFGFDRNNRRAHLECRQAMSQRYRDLAVSCCEGDPNAEYPEYTGRCATNNTTGKNRRSFFGGSGAYHCWPGYTEEQMATGFWLVRADEQEYECQELVDTVAYNEPEETDSTLADLSPYDYEGIGLGSEFSDPRETERSSVDTYDYTLPSTSYPVKDTTSSYPSPYTDPYSYYPSLPLAPSSSPYIEDDYGFEDSGRVIDPLGPVNETIEDYSKEYYEYESTSRLSP